MSITVFAASKKYTRSYGASNACNFISRESTSRMAREFRYDSNGNPLCFATLDCPKSTFLGEDPALPPTPKAKLTKKEHGTPCLIVNLVGGKYEREVGFFGDVLIWLGCQVRLLG